MLPSTAIHELNHVFVNEALRVRNLSPESIVDREAHGRLMADLATLEEWAGVVDGQWTREAHEKVATGFEEYLMEGKAPVKALTGIFGRMKSWIINAYNGAKSLGVPLTDDVRRVFDRMVATDEEIFMNEYQSEAALPLTDFDNPEYREMFSDDDLKKYAEAVDLAKEATEKAVAERRMKEYTARVKQWRREGHDEYDNDRDQRVLRRLREGGINPLSLAAAGYDKDAVAALRKRLPGAVRSDSVLGLDEWAMELAGEGIGDGTADSLKQYIDAVPTRREFLDNYIEEQEKYFEAYDSGDIVMPDEVLDKMAIEQEMLGKFLKKSGLNTQNSFGFLNAPSWREQVRRLQMKEDGKTLDATQKEVLASLKKNLRAKTSEALDMDLRGELMKRGARDDLEQMRFAVNAYSKLAKVTEAAAKYRVASETRALKDKTLAKFRRVAAQKMLPVDSKSGVDPETLSHIKNILAQGGIGQSVVTMRPLNEFLQAKADGNYTVAVPEWIANGQWPKYENKRGRGADRGGTKSMGALTVAQLKDVSQAIDNLLFIGRRSKEVIIDGKRESLAQAEADLIKGMAEGIGFKEQLSQKEMIEKAGDESFGRRIVDLFQGYIPSTVKMETMTRVMDNGQMGGLAQKLLYDPINAAYHNEMRLKEELLEGKFKKLTEATVGLNYLNKMRHRKRQIKGLSIILSDEQRIMMIMNCGNKQNKTSMMQYDFSGTGTKLTEADIQLVIDDASTEERQFCQAVLDFLDYDMYPLMNELHMRNAGVPLKKVEAMEIMTPDGPMRGGYFPLIFDKNMSYAAERQALESAGNDPLKSGNMGQGRTNARSTIERRGTTYSDLVPLLNFNVFLNSVNENIHDLTHREAVQDINALLRQPGIRLAIDGALGKDYTAQMDSWIKAVADPERDYKHGKLISFIRSNVSMASMGAKASIILLQPSGLFQAAAKLGSAWTARGVVEYFKNLPKGIRREIHRKTYEVKERNKQAYDRDVSSSIGDSLTASARQKMNKFVFKGASFMDQIVAEAIWYGGYLRAMKEGKGEEGAADYANRVLRVTNPTGAQKDLSHAQRGWNIGDYGKAFTMFSTFFSGTQNLIWEQVVLSKSNWRKGNYGQAVFQPARLGFLIAVLPAIFDALIKGGWPDSDDEDAWEEYAKSVGLGAVSYVVGGLPIVRDFVELTLDEWGLGGEYNSGRFAPSPLFNAAETVSSGFGEFRDIFDPDEDFRWQSAVRAMGPLTGLPTSQAIITGEGIENFDSDEPWDSTKALFLRPPKE